MNATRISVALLLTLALACGGDEEEAQQGTNTEQTPTEPAGPPPIEPMVCGGDSHTCVLKASGEVFCAGRNLDGELGDGTAQDRWSWAPVSGLSDAKAIACGSYHTCALRQNGEVSCWGRNTHGELGAGNTDVAHAPVAVSGLTGVEEIALGTEFSCARKSDGSVHCWGSGSNGRLGNGARDDSASPVQVTGLTGVAQISLGRGHACARLGDGTVSCWGAGSSRQLGQGEEQRRDSNTPVSVSGVTGATEVAAGGNHSCAVTGSGVMCWGQNDAGQVGNGESGSGTYAPSPVAVTGLTNVTDLDLDTRRSCALLGDGNVQCWGYNNYTAKLLAVGSEEGNVPTPTAVQGVSNAARFDTGETHACAVTNDGKLVCWGSAGNGKLGNGDARSLHVAAEVIPAIAQLSAEPSSLDEFPAAEGELELTRGISVGSHQVCGVKEDGQVFCFGQGSDGRLGLGSTRANPSSGDMHVPGISDAVQVSTGLGRSCALRKNGTVACWGRIDGQVSTSLPMAIEGIDDAKAIDVGGSAHSMVLCAIHQDGGVSCIGGNNSGQLGRGSRGETTMEPARIPDLGDITEIAVGTSSVCALQESGKVYCWGSGSYGQLGNGDTSSSPSPVELSISDAMDLGGGGYNFCAVRRNGSLMCWGSNDDG
ncbi:MAG TPA: hypothetical protein RMI62_05310, partial [Polyangiaceae bacterium LLY-WYZ-15_(1-7)]|nr:hypothetical protein [Polyangiaceae bacterium LLY-WYZ-15_(1-7)]